MTLHLAHGPEFSEALPFDNRWLVKVPDRRLLAASVPPPANPFATIAVNRAIDPYANGLCCHYRASAPILMRVHKEAASPPCHKDELPLRAHMRRDSNEMEITATSLKLGAHFTDDHGGTRFAPSRRYRLDERLPESRQTLQALMVDGFTSLWLRSMYRGFNASRVDEPIADLILSSVIHHTTLEGNRFTGAKCATAMPSQYARAAYSGGKNLSFSKRGG